MALLQDRAPDCPALQDMDKKRICDGSEAAALCLTVSLSCAPREPRRITTGRLEDGGDASWHSP